MNITNAKYIKIDNTDSNGAIQFKVDGVDWSCNMIEGNRHYDEIKKQVDAGELTIADAD